MDEKKKYLELNEYSEELSKSSEEKIILCDKLTSVQVLTLCLNGNTEHIVQKSNVLIDAELKLSSYSLKSPEVFINYPLSVIIGIENPSAETEKEAAGLSKFLSVPSDKEDVLDDLEAYMNEHCKRSSVIADIRVAADELISNSLYNAPYVNQANSNSNVSRDYSNISIDPQKKPHLFAGHDETRAIIGCKDLYGRLNVSKLIERIKLCYINNPGEMINYKAGGAGIGSFMIFDSCMSFYVAVDPEKSTTLCCTFPLKMSAKERDEVPKNVHIILNSSGN